MSINQLLNMPGFRFTCNISEMEFCHPIKASRTSRRVVPKGPAQREINFNRDVETMKSKSNWNKKVRFQEKADIIPEHHGGKHNKSKLRSTKGVFSNKGIYKQNPNLNESIESLEKHFRTLKHSGKFMRAKRHEAERVAEEHTLMRLSSYYNPDYDYDVNPDPYYLARKHYRQNIVEIEIDIPNDRNEHSNLSIFAPSLNFFGEKKFKFKQKASIYESFSSDSYVEDHFDNSSSEENSEDNYVTGAESIPDEDDSLIDEEADRISVLKSGSLKSGFCDTPCDDKHCEIKPKERIYNRPTH